MDGMGLSARSSKNPTSLYRKSMKPLIEKRRRARINASLEQLRKLLQTTPEQQNSRALSRLEKAEILEMTVQQLQQFKKQGNRARGSFSPDQKVGAGKRDAGDEGRIQPMAGSTGTFASFPGAMASPSPNGQDFAAGYRHCINTISSFLSSAGSSLDQEMKSQILRQLEQTPGIRPSNAAIPRPSHPYKVVSVVSPPSSCLWASPPPPQMPAGGMLPLPDTHMNTCSHPSPCSTPSPHPPGPWTQPNSPAAMTRMWRPW